MDASALLALLHNERGGELVAMALENDQVFMSAVNYAEIITCLQRTYHNITSFETWFSSMSVDVHPFDQMMAKETGLLKAKANKLGLSLADCACLALSRQVNAVALTADSAWMNLKEDFNVELIRQTNVT